MESLVPFDSAVLNTPTEPFNFSKPQVSLSGLLSELKEVFYRTRALGVSANQIGYPYSVFIMGDAKLPDAIIQVVNPRIIASHDSVVMDEGCLSYPGLIFAIRRAKEIEVRFADPSGNFMTHKFSGLSARVFQHEMCHMRGETFFRDVSRLRLEMAIKKCHKHSDREYEISKLLPLTNR